MRSLLWMQVLALLLRPRKDHKYRIYWNVYHHLTGYTVIILSVINIFKGFDILDPEKKWKRTYIGIIVTLAAIAVVLEAITWPIVLKAKKKITEKSHLGANGVNAYSVRQTAQAQRLVLVCIVYMVWHPLFVFTFGSDLGLECFVQKLFFFTEPITLIISYYTLHGFI